MEENIKTPTSALARFRDDFAFIRRRQKYRNKKLWGVVKPLKSLQPYANPRNNYICDLIIIFRLLNATFVIPEIQETTRSKGNEVSETYTGDGSVDAKGKPAVKQNTEYWRACWFIIGTLFCIK
ncbi:hypothetical protein F8388_012859 [Cannabis sativa]|uniref:Uncharacterized protein n=1 Tax=Cannabis sativa TaxID=3483 RepID=A0A7J6DZF8_CANSA|nr:hypothetical protein G4B88_029212 [Cannabis sativa]KAF4361399.1 hypothetical protein F8388_012859 [Cannabis sativa]